MTRRGDWGTTRACWEARDLIWSLDDAGRSSGATSFAEPQRPPLEVDRRHGQGRHGDVPRSRTAAGRLRKLPLGGDRHQSSLACQALGWPPPPASHVFIVMRLNMSTLGGLVAASTQAGSFRWEAEADVLLLDARACSWQQPESRLLRRASHRGTQGPTRPPNHSVQTGPPHREQSGGVHGGD